MTPFPRAGDAESPGLPFRETPGLFARFLCYSAFLIRRTGISAVQLPWIGIRSVTWA